MIQQDGAFLITRLRSGGLMTNYGCTSRCAHCLYRCGPGWPKQYMDGETLDRTLEKTLELGCRSVHIGGGEPFLDPEGLHRVVEATLAAGVAIEYVETNSSWYRDRASARDRLSSLKALGLSTLLVSMSPFHNEHVPFFKVKGVLEACRAAGMNVFPWIPEFYPEIDRFDDHQTHALSEYQETYGRDYLEKIPARYWVHLGGRALETFSGVIAGRDYRDILDSERGGCRELLDVGHFHFDLFGNYIPGLCSGLAVACEDMGRPLLPETYPFLTALFRKGINGLYDLASGRYGFSPAGGYLNKCDLCTDIRRHLVLAKGVSSRDLQPKAFYGMP